MGTHILRAGIRAIFIMLIVMTSIFLILRLGPMAPAEYILGDYATPETIASFNQAMGLDQPLHEQYFRFVKKVLRGDLGSSFMHKQPVLLLLMDVLPYTMELIAAGMLMGLLIGIPPGILAALKPNSIYDQAVRFITMLGMSLPSFVVGIFLMSIFSLQLDWLPAFGGGDENSFSDRMLRLILPALSVGIMKLAAVARLTRASLLEVLGKDYILTARSKGLKESIVVLKHALRNSLLPLVTFIGIYINILLGAAVLIEVIFARPGVGRLIVEAIKGSDFPVVQTVIMFYAGAVVLVNLSIDVFYSLIDPRIRLK